MFRIIQGSEACCLSHTGSIKRPTNLVHFREERSGADAVTNAKSRQTIHLRKGTQYQQITASTNEVYRARVVRIVDVIAICLVKHDENVFRHSRKKSIEVVGAKHRAGGIVRIGQKNKIGFFGEIASDRFQVEMISAHGNV